MKRTFVIVFLAVLFSSPIMAKDNCRAPNCSWLKTTNGKLYAGGPIRHGVPYYWKGWPAYDAMLCKKYGECRSK